MNKFYEVMELIHSDTMKIFIANKLKFTVSYKDISIDCIKQSNDSRSIIVESSSFYNTFETVVSESDLELLLIKQKFSDSNKYIILSAHTRADGVWQYWTDEDYTDDIDKAGIYTQEYVNNLLGVEVCKNSIDFEVAVNRNKYISTDSGQLVLETDTAIPLNLITTILKKQKTIIFV